MNFIFSTFKKASVRYVVFLKWGFIASLTGIVVGLIGTLFRYAIDFVTEFCTEHTWILWFLPLAGVIIILSNKLLKMENDIGTNVIFNAIHKNEKITIKTAPLIFIGTVLTHLCGGSSGSEGAALQLGASISTSFNKFFKLDDKDQKILTMCGMSAGFAAIFGTPITATVFAIEVFSVGIMYYAALLPCSISALIGFSISRYFNIAPPLYKLLYVPTISIGSAFKTIIIGIACAALSIIFCLAIKNAGKYYKMLFKNQYIRIITGGVLIIILTLIIGDYDYNGAGANIISNAITGDSRPEAFALKIVLTALTLGAGYKGGEIFPSFFIGSTFGNVLGRLISFSPSFSAGIGLSAFFCAVTNCPLTSIILGVELFGTSSLPLFLIAISVSYMLSGYFGLYSSQKIVYSKTRNEYIDRNLNK